MHGQQNIKKRMKIIHQNEVGHFTGTVRFQQLIVVCCKCIVLINIL